MPNLFPSFPASAMVGPEQPTPPQYKKAVLFDFAAGEFVTDGGGRVLEADGQTAWEQWCVKAVITTRYAYLAYGQNYGSEAVNILKKYPTRAAREAEIRRDITETLMADPRTAAVKDFSFVWEGESGNVRFRAVPVIGDATTLGVTING